MDEIAIAKLEMVGLTPEDGDKFPAELSGGMTKRVALARALALDPAIVFLDEPTSGLDPIAAGDFDALIKTLQQTLGLTVFMVTHDLASLYTECDRVAALADGKIVAIGPMQELLQSEHPWVRAYFHGKRSQMLQPRRVKRWKRALLMPSSAPSCWRPSSRCSASCTGSTTPAGSGRAPSYHVQFDGSVPGLLVGAGVLFNGIRVGEVTELGACARQSHAASPRPSR